MGKVRDGVSAASGEPLIEMRISASCYGLLHTYTQAHLYTLGDAPACALARLCTVSCNHMFGKVIAVALCAYICASLCVFGINSENKHYHLTKAPSGSP